MHKIFSFAAVVLFASNITTSGRADGPLPPPINAEGEPVGQYGANRRVVSSESEYTAVRGRFSLPSVMKVTSSNLAQTYLASESQLANSKPSFYLGSSVGTAEADAGVQYEWESLPVDTNGVRTYVKPGWGVFARANSTGGNWYMTPKGGWRGGAGTSNPGLTGFDLAWVVRPFSGSGIGIPVAYYGYLEVVALGVAAANQPKPRDNQIRETGTTNCRLVPYENSNPSAVTFTNTTTGMSVKRVVAMTQGGSYNQGSQTSVVHAVQALDFPLPNGGLYSEDGSYMRGVTFSGWGGGPAGQVSFGTPIFVQTNPSWVDWGTNAAATSNRSVAQDGDRDSTGFYPYGLDRTVTYRNYPGGPTTATGIAAGALPYFAFPGLTGPINSEAAQRYNTETVDINLRSGVFTSGVLVTRAGTTPAGTANVFD